MAVENPEPPLPQLAMPELGLSRLKNRFVPFGGDDHKGACGIRLTFSAFVFPTSVATNFIDMNGTAVS